jgi:hypothetical protein
LCALPLPCEAGKKNETVSKRTLLVSGLASASVAGGTLCVSLELFKGGRRLTRYGSGSFLAATALLEGRLIEARAVVHERSYPCGWQAWRVAVAPADRECPFSLTVTVAADPETDLRWEGHFIPDSRL